VNDGIICKILLVLNVVSIAQPLYKGVGLYVIQRQLYIIGFISAVQHLCKGLPCTSAIDRFIQVYRPIYTKASCVFRHSVLLLAAG